MLLAPKSNLLLLHMLPEWKCNMILLQLLIKSDRITFRYNAKISFF